MIPSRVSAKLSVDLDSHEVHEMIIRCYNQVYSPKLTLEELTAELEASVKIEVINQKESLLKGVDFFGLRVKAITLCSLASSLHKGLPINPVAPVIAMFISAPVLEVWLLFKGISCP